MKCPHCQYDNPENTRYCGQCGRELLASLQDPAFVTHTYQTPERGMSRGTTFARRFEIIEEIGKGGMGTVFKAFDTKITEEVALKILKPEIASDPAVVERFRNEIKFARQISHRHVCRMYDLDEEALSIYISMEFVAGEDLKSFIRRSGHLNEAKVLNLARQIAEGLAEAHRLGVIHRDLKPQNIMIDREGNAKIMDFGIARSIHTRGVTGTGVIIGTPEYMSPEQADARDVDHRTDIYAFGAILYEMLTGRVPFDGETPLSIVLKHKSEPAPDPKDINAQVSPGISRIILRCLEKAKDRRYASMNEIIEEIDRLEKDLPAPPQPAVRKKSSTSKELTLRLDLKRIAAPGIAVLAVVIVAALLIINGISKKETGGGETGGVVPPVLEGESAAGAKRPAFREEMPGVRASRSPIAMIDMEAFFEEAARYIEPEELEKLKAGITSIKNMSEADAQMSSIWGSVQDRIKEARAKTGSGTARDSEKTYTRSLSEMQKVLNLVKEKERADQARQDMLSSKKRALASLRTRGQNLLSWIAGIKEKDAADAYQKEDFAGARILYDILHKVYSLSPNGGDEKQCLAALQGLVSTVRAEAETARAPEKEDWLFSMAEDEEVKAREALKNDGYAESAELFILSAFLYQKARDVALESDRPGERYPSATSPASPR